MQTALNRFIETLKWPAALFMLVTLPALFQSLSWFKFGQPKYLVMFAGFFIYFIPGQWPMRRLKPACRLLPMN